jgi:sporulation protein YlmC with PRC-barrel domain
MESSFGQEMLGRIVQDRKGKEVGTLVDFVIDISNGEISDLVIAIGNNLDISRVSYPSKEGNVYIPSTDVSSFGQVILLKI